ncbi:MAG: DUF4197 domain-containing protein [Candidatus Omnitrophica bacterium]|nr:DUF4197 domain-containing protein [Candidatus Omnitrophota bacterium]
MKKKIVGLSLSFLVLCVCFEAHAGSFDWLKNVFDKGAATKLSDTKIGAGLKEALKVGIENAITSLGKKDGYFANQAVKVLLPETIRKFEPMLRSAGLGSRIDEFVLSMNRAAENAAPAAADIFSTAIADMSFDDVQKIFKGGNTAATEYLKAKTSKKLLAQFQPLVQKSINEFAVTKKFEEIITMAKDLPVVGSYAKGVNIKDYVSSKALDGLFTMLAKEEGKIRTDPAARVTSVLQEVFK